MHFLPKNHIVIATSLIFGIAACGSNKAMSEASPSLFTMSDKSSLTIRNIKQHAHNSGNLITIQGSGLLGVVYVSLGGKEVKFSTDSDDRLFIEVPEAFQSGLVELRTEGVVGLSKQPVVISGLAHSASTL